MDLLIVGLGNPGRQYDKTRHNVGFDFIEILANRFCVTFKRALFAQATIGKTQIADAKLALAVPFTYMNNSGDIFPSILKQTNMDLSNLVVVCDNMDLAPGHLRLKSGGSSGGQKGLQSIIDRVGTKDFCRLFIGIGRPSFDNDVISHVLSKAPKDESLLIYNAMEFAAKEIISLTNSTYQKVATSINSYNPDEH